MNQNSGGHRFGSNAYLGGYTPEAYNGGLLDLVGNKMKQSPIDAALSATPLGDALTTGLLSERNGGNYGGGTYDFGGKSTANDTPSADDGGLSGWGTNKDGYGYSVDGAKSAKNAIAGMQALGPIGALAGFASGVSKYSDPLGQFTYNQLKAQVERDAIAAGISANNPNSAGLTSQANAMEGDALGNLMGLTNSFGTGGSDSSSGGFGGGFGGGDLGGSGLSSGGYGGSGLSSGGYGGTSASDGGFGGGFGSAGGFGGGFGGGSDSDSGGWANGGSVTKARLQGPNPIGKDDGYGALDDGEFVVKASSVKKYGKGLLSDINNGTFKR